MPIEMNAVCFRVSVLLPRRITVLHIYHYLTYLLCSIWTCLFEHQIFPESIIRWVWTVCRMRLPAQTVKLRKKVRRHIKCRKHLIQASLVQKLGINMVLQPRNIHVCDYVVTYITIINVLSNTFPKNLFITNPVKPWNDILLVVIMCL